MHDIKITALENCGDTRGALYNVPDSDVQFLNNIQNIHFGKICPGSIRGNHYHHQSKEMLIISYSDIWTLAWAKRDSNEISIKEFAGSGAVLIKVDEGVVHAVKNSGDKDLEIIALSNRIFSKESSDTIAKILLQ